MTHLTNNQYNLVSKRSSSRPPFVFFFNPTIQLQQFTKSGFNYYVGYRIKRDDGIWVGIDFNSLLKQNNEFCTMHNIL